MRFWCFILYHYCITASTCQNTFAWGYKNKPLSTPQACTTGWVFASLDPCHRCLHAPQLTMTGILPLPGSLSPNAWAHWGDQSFETNCQRTLSQSGQRQLLNLFLNWLLSEGLWNAFYFMVVIFAYLNISCDTFCWKGMFKKILFK